MQYKNIGHVVVIVFLTFYAWGKMMISGEYIHSWNEIRMLWLIIRAIP